MCCYKDDLFKEEFLKRMKKQRRKTFVGFKVLLRPFGCAPIGKQQYHPGLNLPNRLHKRYDTRNPTGIHVYRSRDRASLIVVSTWETVIPVICHVDDIFVMDRTVCVLTKVRITKKAWLEARFSL